MHRHQIAALEQWLAAPRRKPLVIRGARQVGKSTLVRLFCEAAGRPLVTVDLERRPELAAAFGHVREPRALLNLIETAANAPVGPDAVLFLDEIQAAPPALAALRYFLEDMPEQPVLAAGSLMEFALAEQALPMPVGRVSYLHMGPMTFTEFLRGSGQERLAGQIDAFDWSSPSMAPEFDAHQFVAEKDVELAVRFDARPPSLQTVEAGVPGGARANGKRRVRYRLLSLPLYLIERLPEILREVVGPG